MLLIWLTFNLIFVLLQISESDANECGTVKYIEPKITGGSLTSRGEWPFIAALYYTDEAKFFCGATLISQKHVLTAAHCVQQKNSAFKLSPEDVVVLLGVYNLDSKLERGVQQRDVDQIHVHPDWKVYHEKYDADIAIFVLNNIVVFTRYIRPVCITADDDIVHNVRGSIVGWGLAENTTVNKHESIPRHAFTTALNDSYCYTTDRFLAIFSSTRTFCGGADMGSPNKGDSGGGFFVRSGTVWTQYGIISASLSDARGVVLPNTFSVYTNVRSFKDWIFDITENAKSVEPLPQPNLDSENSGTEVETHKLKVKFYCNYELASPYKCSVWEANATMENLEVETFTGAHLTEYTDQNVTEIWFWHGTLNYIPDGIGLIFKHLERFLVGYDDRNLGLKLLKRSNFENMKLVKLLQFHLSDIETIDEDTLWDLPNLDFFHLINSKLKQLHEKTFEKNMKLRIIRAHSNQLEFLPSNLFNNNPLIEEIQLQNNKLRTISVDFNALKLVRFIDFHGNICIDKSLTDFENLSDFQSLIREHC